MSGTKDCWEKGFPVRESDPACPAAKAAGIQHNRNNIPRFKRFRMLDSVSIETGEDTVHRPARSRKGRAQTAAARNFRARGEPFEKG